MANTLLSPTVITREAQRILHQKCNFIGSIDRQYDDRFARTGAKIGNSLAIREPNQFTVRTGKAIDVQDVTETSQTLTVATQKGVDINFSSADLTMTIDDFSKRYLDPAMSVLAANMEADTMTMYKDIYNSMWSSGNAITYNDVLSGRVLLQRSLAPGNDRTANMNPQDMADLVKDTKTLFNAQSQIADQYVEGYMGKADNCIERGAYFMTHIGQEFRLRTRGSKRIFFCLDQLGAHHPRTRASSVAHPRHLYADHGDDRPRYRDTLCANTQSWPASHGLRRDLVYTTRVGWLRARQACCLIAPSSSSLAR